MSTCAKPKWNLQDLSLTCYIVISYFLYFSQKTWEFIPKAVVYGAWRWKTHTASFLASWTPLCIAVASIWTSPWPSTSSPLSFTPIKEDGVACANRKAWKFSSSLCSLWDGFWQRSCKVVWIMGKRYFEITSPTFGRENTMLLKPHT